MVSIQSSNGSLFHKVYFTIKVVVRAEILPRDFLQTLGNYYLSLTEAKFHRQKVSSIFKGSDREIINFQE